MKTFLCLVLVIAFASCTSEPLEKIQTGNSEIELHLLFEHDGCKVYRFKDGDGRNVYWSDCRGDMQSSYQQSSGKTTHTITQQSINTGR